MLSIGETAKLLNLRETELNYYVDARIRFIKKIRKFCLKNGIAQPNRYYPPDLRTLLSFYYDADYLEEVQNAMIEFTGTYDYDEIVKHLERTDVMRNSAREELYLLLAQFENGVFDWFRRLTDETNEYLIDYRRACKSGSEQEKFLLIAIWNLKIKDKLTLLNMFENDELVTNDPDEICQFINRNFKYVTDGTMFTLSAHSE